MEHVRLGRVVDGHQRPGLERGGRRHVQDSPPPLLHHARKNEPRQVRQGLDVQADHPEGGAEIGFREGAVGPEARVVDQNLDRPPGERRKELRCGAGRGEVHRDRAHGDAVPLGQLTRDPLERLRAPRHDRQVVAIGGQQPRQLVADARGGAGHDRPLPPGGSGPFLREPVHERGRPTTCWSASAPRRPTTWSASARGAETSAARRS